MVQCCMAVLHRELPSRDRLSLQGMGCRGRQDMALSWPASEPLAVQTLYYRATHYTATISIPTGSHQEPY